MRDPSPIWNHPGLEEPCQEGARLGSPTPTWSVVPKFGLVSLMRPSVWLSSLSWAWWGHSSRLSPSLSVCHHLPGPATRPSSEEGYGMFGLWPLCLFFSSGHSCFHAESLIPSAHPYCGLGCLFLALCAMRQPTRAVGARACTHVHTWEWDCVLLPSQPVH